MFKMYKMNWLTKQLWKQTEFAYSIINKDGY